MLIDNGTSNHHQRHQPAVKSLQDLLKFVTLEELWADLAAGGDHSFG